VYGLGFGLRSVNEGGGASGVKGLEVRIAS
jgi:hypothetical protein